MGADDLLRQQWSIDRSWRLSGKLRRLLNIVKCEAHSNIGKKKGGNQKDQTNLHISSLSRASFFDTDSTSLRFWFLECFFSLNVVFHVKVMLSLCFFGQVVLEVGLELAVLAHKRVLASFPCKQVPENEKFLKRGFWNGTKGWQFTYDYESEKSSPGDAETGLKHEKELCSGRVAADWGTVGRLEAHVVLEIVYFSHMTWRSIVL